MLAITAKGSDLASALDPRFGRCSYFLLVDEETGKVEAVANEAVGAAGGAGTLSARLLAERGVTAVLTGNVGPKAMQALLHAGIKVYRVQAGTAQEALECFRNNQCQELSWPTVRSHSGTN